MDGTVRSMRRLCLLGVAVLLCAAMTAATTVREESVVLNITGEPAADVTVTREYADISSERLSYLVPQRYDPQSLSVRDGIGELDCDIDRSELWQEILCTPRKRANYTVTVSYRGDFVSRQGGRFLFAYDSSVLFPTERAEMQVVLPAGTGLVSGDGPSYSPPNASVGSSGRRIFISWTDTDIALGDTLSYQVRYERLEPIERYVPVRVLGAVAAVIVVVAGVVAVVYLRRDREDGKTIASVFPMLKDDEQTVMRYIIDAGGEVEQRDIVADVDYSKAKISKLLSDLEERHLITKEKSGRVNVVALAREVGDLDADNI